MPAKEKSAHFDAVSKHLDLGGVVYGYADFDGDIDYMASRAQGMIDRMAKQLPQAAQWGKIDLKPYLKLLGLEDLKAVGFSSVDIGDGEYLNRGFLYLPAGRNGIFAVAGGPASPPKFLDLAPADADIYEEAEINVSALASLVKKIWLQTGQKDSEEKFEQQLTQNPSGVNGRDLVQHLHGRLALIVKLDPEKTLTIPAPKPFVLPAFSLLIIEEGIGKDVQPALDNYPMLDHTDEPGRRFYRSKMGMMVPGFRPAIAVVGSDLYVTTDEYFLHQCLDRAAGTGLGSNAEFQRLAKETGVNSNLLGYVTPRFYQQLSRLSELNPTMDEQQAAFFKMMSSVMDDVKHPLLQMTQNQPDGIYYVGRLNHSWKPQIAAAAVYPVVIACSAIATQQRLAAMRANQGTPADGNPNLNAAPSPPSETAPPPTVAPEAPPSAASLSPDQRVQKNLRTLRALARIYYRRTGKTTATYGDLIGEGKIISKDLEVIEGEDYHTVQLEEGKPVEITLPDGRVISAPPARARSAPALGP